MQRWKRCGLLQIILLIFLATAVGACGAPRSRAARGPVAEQVSRSLAEGRGVFDHGAWDRLLDGGTLEGRVDYHFMAAHRAELDGYLAALATVDLAALAPSELEALLINAYNAYTVQSILDRPGVSSIREIAGVWTSATHAVGGFELTLDAIEHSLLRPFFRDPRIHFAVNCASTSCAPLPSWAFAGERLEAQLEERTHAFLGSPDQARMDGETLLLSRYFDWYGDDFVAPGWSPRADTIATFVARYSPPELQAAIAAAGGDPPLHFLDYDWSLNAVRRGIAGVGDASPTR